MILQKMQVALEDIPGGELWDIGVDGMVVW